MGHRLPGRDRGGARRATGAAAAPDRNWSSRLSSASSSASTWATPGRQEAGERFGLDVVGIQSTAMMRAFREDLDLVFGWFDLLWAGLAVFTAWRVTAPGRTSLRPKARPSRQASRSVTIRPRHLRVGGVPFNPPVAEGPSDGLPRLPASTRADGIYALEPLRGDERGGGRRTRVWVEGSRTPSSSRTAPSGRSCTRWDRTPRPGRPPRRRARARRAACRRREEAASTSPISGGARAWARFRATGRGPEALLKARLRRLAVDLTPLRGSPAFRRLWFGTGISAIRSQITTVAIPFQVYRLTGSTLLVGLLGVAALVPLLTVPLYAGAVADAVDRRLLLLWSDVALALVSVVLLVNALADEPRASRSSSSPRPSRPRRTASSDRRGTRSPPARSARAADGRDRRRGRRLQPRSRRRPRARRSPHRRLRPRRRVRPRRRDLRRV